MTELNIATASKFLVKTHFSIDPYISLVHCAVRCNLEGIAIMLDISSIKIEISTMYISLLLKIWNPFEIES